jgi:hypothetical protein
MAFGKDFTEYKNGYTVVIQWLYSGYTVVIRWLYNGIR